MAKAEAKTRATEVPAGDFLAAVPDPLRRGEGLVLDALHRRVTGQEPKMWGPSIVGYGSYHYHYDSGREGTMCRAGFSPRKAALTLYLVGGFTERQTEADALFAQLGKHTAGVSCLYIKKLSDIDEIVLEELVRLSWEVMNAKYPE